ncbi:MAG: DUF115 domain-containing protein [Planctomycetes bacterium]|nr:DUF115 domain-containing protein [Planctomycetota bacterium]
MKEMRAAGHFEHNLALLKKRWPEAARRVESVQPLAAGQVVFSRCGEPTLKVLSEAGTEVWLHSRYRPAEEADRQLEALQIGAQDAVVVLGVGLGYPLLSAVRRGRSTTFVVALEKDPAVWRAALECQPLDEFLNHPEAELIVGAAPEELFALLDQKVSRFFAGSIKIFSHPASAQAFPSYYQSILQSLGEFARYGSVVLRSALYLSRIAIQNRFSNLPDYLASPGIRPLIGKFQGYPGVVVAAGPSLERNVEELRRLQGRAVIVAVSTALKILLGRGLQPHLTAIIDYHTISSRYFAGIAPELAAPIVCDPKASAEAIASYSGARFFSNDALINTLLDGSAGDKGDLVTGSTVAHAAFHIARALGCNPIILVGLDLSFPEGRLHAAGTATHEQHFSETSRFYTFEMKEWEWYLSHRKTLMKVPGLNGGEVFTDDVFFSYLREFEQMFQEAPSR